MAAHQLVKNTCVAMQPSAETPFFPDDSSAVIQYQHPAAAAHLHVSVDLMVLGPPVGSIPWYVAFCVWLILNEQCVLKAPLCWCDGSSWLSTPLHLELTKTHAAERICEGFFLVALFEV